MTEHIHHPPGTEVQSIGGHYTIIEEGRMNHNYIYISRSFHYIGPQMRNVGGIVITMKILIKQTSEAVKNQQKLKERMKNQ